MGELSQYHPSSEQRELAAGFERPLEELLPLARLHEQPAGESDARWSSIAEIGLFGIGLSEDVGGSGLGSAEEVLLAERLGRQLASPSLLATLSAGHADDPALASRIAVGELRVAGGWRRDGELRVIDGEGAELALILDDDKAVLTAVTKGEALDGRLWACSLQAVPAGDAVASLTGRALLRARLVLAAALCGIAGAATDMAVAYAGMREQFGRPIGAFQAVKHHCANMALAARSALDLVTFAAVAVDNDREDAAFQTEAALLLAIEAALKNARTNIQVHGGMGFSDEADAHLLVKRAHGLAAIAGGGEAAAARLGPLPGAMRA